MWWHLEVWILRQWVPLDFHIREQPFSSYLPILRRYYGIIKGVRIYFWLKKRMMYVLRARSSPTNDQYSPFIAHTFGLLSSNMLDYFIQSQPELRWMQNHAFEVDLFRCFGRQVIRDARRATSLKTYSTLEDICAGVCSNTYSCSENYPREPAYFFFSWMD